MQLVEDLKQMAEEEEPCKYEKQTLLSKYQIPVQNLEFEYIRKCQNGKELEKILHILRSGEEGYFPDLIKTTEKRLIQIKPHSKLLRKVCPVLNKEEISKDEWENLSQDLKDWVKDVNRKDRELEERKIKSQAQIMDGVRKGKTVYTEMKSNPKRIASTDYESWDKYDPDTEILKMDLEDEKLKKDALKMQEEKKTKAKVVRFNNFATEAEAIFEANHEKERGNECFKAKEYQTALHHYTNSLECKPIAAVYTNRALVFNKLKEYKKGIDDCTAALKLEPRNFKAHLRLAQNYEALEQYDDALKSIEQAIEIDPNNIAAQELANRLNKMCGKTVINKRFEIEEVDSNNTSSSKDYKQSNKTLNAKPLKPILKSKSKFKTENDDIPALQSGDINTKMEFNHGSSLKEHKESDGKSNKKSPKSILKPNNKFELENEAIPTLESADLSTDITENQLNEEQNCITKHMESKDKTRSINLDQLIPEISNNTCKTTTILKNPKNLSNEQETKNKNLMTKNKYKIISIPGTSKMPPPYYKIIESNDPDVIKREKQKIFCRPTLLHLTTIDVTSDDECQKDQHSILQSNFLNYQAKHGNYLPTLKIKDDTRNSKEKNLKTATNMKTSDGRNKHKKSKFVLQKNKKVTENKNDQNEKGGGGEPYNNDQEQLIPTAEELQSPYTFIQIWNSIRKDTTYKQHAQILKKMDMKRIPDVIGYKLDDTMISNIINCLYRHFMVPGELDNLQSILINITRIPRFKTMSMFLEEADWRCISQLTKFLDQHGRNLPADIKDVYYNYS